jgi:hypothetical protein
MPAMKTRETMGPRKRQSTAGHAKTNVSNYPRKGVKLKMTFMIGPRRRTATFLSGIVLTLVALVSLASAATAEEPAKVIAHITLPGTAVRGIT